MSINWVMLTPAGDYTPLPGETTIYTSPPRTFLHVKSPSGYPGTQPYDLQSGPGKAYLTTRRVIFIPASPTPQFQTFHAPLLNCQNSRVAAPWFGANKWECELQPVPNGGLPPQYQRLEFSLTFKDGGAYDFFTYFTRVVERLQQAISVARESGEGADAGSSRGGDALAGVDLNSVHLDELPAYEETSQHPVPEIVNGMPSPPMPQDSGFGSSPPVSGTPQMSPAQENFQPPNEPPPGYDEVLTGSVSEELERRLREEAERNGR